MRVNLEVGNKTVDVENNIDDYQTADEAEMFFDLLKSGLLALGYTELEIFVYLSGANKKEEK